MNFVIGLMITVGSYCLIPLLTASSCKKAMTKKKYGLFCFLGNIFVMVLFYVMSESFSYSPYIIWTTLFYNVGKGFLRERGMLIENKVASTNEAKLNVKPDMKKFICDECGAVSVGWYNECPNCHKEGKMRNGTEAEILKWNE